MTRKNDDKRGNPEFDGMDKREAEYSRKIEARFTKEAGAKDQQGKAGTRWDKLNGSHKGDKR